MLFDLRARGRRRAIKVIYASLAILMGGGLVFFGIGGETQGGLFDAFSDNSQSGDDLVQERVDNAVKATESRPQDPAAWAALARARYQQAGQGDNFDQAQGIFTDDGKDTLRQATQAWQRHLSLAGKKPDLGLANLMVQAYGPAGLNELDQAVRSLELVVESREPTAALYTQLSALAYTAGQTRKGDLARSRALELANPDDREVIKGQLDAAKSQAQAQSQTSTTPTTTPSTVPAG